MQELRYIVFDGDVDALWVENMNSVMDDNKLLTLPNSERLRLNDHCKLIIEVGDLQHASPATGSDLQTSRQLSLTLFPVSRVGMAYVDPKNLGFRPAFDRWLRARRMTAQTPFEAGLRLLRDSSDYFVSASVYQM